MDSFEEIEGAVAVLLKAKEESGVSGAAIAAACGMSHATVSSWLHGRTIPTADNWICAMRGCGFEVIVQPIVEDVIVEQHQPKEMQP